MKSYRNIICKIIKDLQIKSLSNYTYKNINYDVNYGDEPMDLISNIKNRLYSSVHCINIQSPVNSNIDNNFAFTNILSNANKGNGTWDPYWQIKKTNRNVMIVEKDGLKLWVKKELIQIDPTRNDYALIKIPKEYRERLNGFYVALGNETYYRRPDVPDLRFYWNIPPKFASLLVSKITGVLNEFKIPFNFKIPNRIEYFPRADAGVLYIQKENLEESIAAIKQVFEKTQTVLNSETPLLAKKLGNGLSFAESPSHYESFGQNRCRLLAESFVSSFSKNIRSIESMLDETDLYFEQHSIDLTRPYSSIDNIAEYDKILNQLRI